MRLKQLFVLASLLAAMACGSSSSPVAPTNANVAGTWIGTMQYTQAPTGTAAQFTQAVSMSLTQNGTTVGGTWTTTNSTPRNGTVGGGITTNAFSGSFTYNATSTGGNPCTGTLTVSGAVSGNSLNWTSPAISENCTDPPTNISISAVRQ